MHQDFLCFQKRGRGRVEAQTLAQATNVWLGKTFQTFFLLSSFYEKTFCLHFTPDGE